MLIHYTDLTARFAGPSVVTGVMDPMLFVDLAHPARSRKARVPCDWTTAYVLQPLRGQEWTPQTTVPLNVSPRKPCTSGYMFESG